MLNWNPSVPALTAARGFSPSPSSQPAMTGGPGAPAGLELPPTSSSPPTTTAINTHPPRANSAAINPREPSHHRRDSSSAHHGHKRSLSSPHGGPVQRMTIIDFGASAFGIGGGHHQDGPRSVTKSDVEHLLR